MKPEIDENWITPSAMAHEAGVTREAVSNWIIRKKIEFIVLPGAKHRRHLVDRRTAPVPAKVGVKRGSRMK